MNFRFGAEDNPSGANGDLALLKANHEFWRESSKQRSKSTRTL